MAPLITNDAPAITVLFSGGEMANVIGADQDPISRAMGATTGGACDIFSLNVISKRAEKTISPGIVKRDIP